MSLCLSREEALELLHTHTPQPHLLQHAKAAEAVLHALATHLNEDAELWSRTGLLHDIDYAQTEQNHAAHGIVACDILADKLPEEALQAIRAHNGEMTGTSPNAKLDYALRCGETVTGLVITAALVRPTGISGMEAKSLKKKMKDKAFAASVSRENIRQCSELGLELDTFLQLAIQAMQAQAVELNLPTGE